MSGDEDDEWYKELIRKNWNDGVAAFGQSGREQKLFLS
jgi:hypothetical protein